MYVHTYFFMTVQFAVNSAGCFGSRVGDLITLRLHTVRYEFVAMAGPVEDDVWSNSVNHRTVFVRPVDVCTERLNILEEVTALARGAPCVAAVHSACLSCSGLLRILIE